MIQRWNMIIREAMDGFRPSDLIAEEQRRFVPSGYPQGTKISGVILAAGLSSRAGMFKMTCPLDGMTVIERCIQGMINVCDEVIVVGGYQHEKLDFLSDRYKKIRLVYNPDYTEGMFSSLRRGVSEASGYQVFITPGDCPLIPENIYKALLSVQANAVVPSFSGMNGHPILLGRPAVNALLASRHDSLRVFLRAYGYAVLPVDEPSILFDLDTPDDYKAILALIRIREHKVVPIDRKQKSLPKPIS